MAFSKVLNLVRKDWMLKFKTNFFTILFICKPILLRYKDQCSQRKLSNIFIPYFAFILMKAVLYIETIRPDWTF